MVTTGLKYGYATSGETLVFLKIKASDPRMLSYYMNPTPRWLADGFDVRYAPASLLATFAIMALHLKRESPDWISSVEGQLYQWLILPPNLNLQDITPQPGASNSEETTGDSNQEEDAGDVDYQPPTRAQL